MPGAYHLPTSIILINHCPNSSYTYILRIEEELASRIESASFAYSHLGYLLFIVFLRFFFSLSLARSEEEKNRIKQERERERCSDIGCSTCSYSSMIGRYLLLYVDGEANFFFSFSSPFFFSSSSLLLCIIFSHC